ncbi:MAG: DNA-deoxyinosine glycosylase [Eubacteriales bacterium]|nr:DNA-deoxyinosine glycosylase [Eubacteriales bacterium]
MLEPAQTIEIRSFSYAINEQCRVLVLGTMPGIASLRKQEYYGHPRNAFWPILASWGGFLADSPYEERLRRLNASGVALWDVAQTCVRKGSLDADIRRERPNDIAGLLAAHPAVQAVIFNGKGAQKLFEKHIGTKSLPGITFFCAPSTSPAYTLGYAEKKTAWHNILNEAMEESVCMQPLPRNKI